MLFADADADFAAYADAVTLMLPLMLPSMLILF